MMHKVFFELLRYKILDTYLGVAYKNRQAIPLQEYANEKQEAIRLLDTLQQLKKLNKKPPLPVQNYAGTYNNELYGNITLEPLSDHSLTIKFLHHAKLSATLTYLENNDWELRYSPVSYGIFKSRVDIEKNKVKSILIKAADFVEYDSYLFTKME